MTPKVFLRKVKTVMRLFNGGRSLRAFYYSLPFAASGKIRRINSGGGLALRSVIISVTQRCTLRCCKCCALIQYFKSPQDVPSENIYRDIDAIMEKADYVRRLCFVGGETLLVKELPEYIQYAIEKYKSKISFIQIVTNGTVMPSEDYLAKLKKTRKYLSVGISDYGELSSNADRLNARLRKLRIYSLADKADSWLFVEQLIDGESQSSDYAEKTYRKCTKICPVVLNGKYYHCAFLAHGEMLRAFPYSDDNHVDILDSNTTKADIAKYQLPENTPPACRYCSGIYGGDDKDAVIIPSAEQVKEPVSYKVYEQERQS